MKFQTLTHKPNNPQHFVILCFRALKFNEDLAENETLIVKIGEFKNKALFCCFYGYFWVDRNRTVLSQEFHLNKKEAILYRNKFLN